MLALMVKCSTIVIQGGGGKEGSDITGTDGCGFEGIGRRII